MSTPELRVERDDEHNGREECIAEARAWLADPNSVILDFETTDLHGFAVEIGIVGMDGTVLMSERLWPGDGERMNPQAESTHGISLKTLEGRPTFAERFHEIARHLAGKHVITYNVAFDRQIFMAELARIRIFTPSFAMWSCDEEAKYVPTKWSCAMLLYSEYVGQRRWDGSVKWQRLPGGDHSAAGDALACLAVLRRMAGQ